MESWPACLLQQSTTTSRPPGGNSWQLLGHSSPCFNGRQHQQEPELLGHFRPADLSLGQCVRQLLMGERPGEGCTQTGSVPSASATRPSGKACSIIHSRSNPSADAASMSSRSMLLFTGRQSPQLERVKVHLNGCKYGILRDVAHSIGFEVLDTEEEVCPETTSSPSLGLSYAGFACLRPMTVWRTGTSAGSTPR